MLNILDGIAKSAAFGFCGTRWTSPPAIEIALGHQRLNTHVGKSETLDLGPENIFVTAAAAHDDLRRLPSILQPPRQLHQLLKPLLAAEIAAIKHRRGIGCTGQRNDRIGIDPKRNHLDRTRDANFLQLPRHLFGQHGDRIDLVEDHALD